MMEKKHSERQDDSYYDALIKQRIGEALRNQSKKERLDLAQLEAWVEADRQRRRAKVKRVLAIASCFIIICAGTFSFKFAFDDDAVATAGKNDNKVNQNGNNAVVKPNEEGADENTGESTVTCETWEAVEEAKKSYTNLVMPKYIPEGFEFKVLSINLSENIEQYDYQFTSDDDSFEIVQFIGGDVRVFNNYDRKIKQGDYEVFIKEGSNKNSFYQTGDDVIAIIGDCTDQEVIKILQNLK